MKLIRETGPYIRNEKVSVNRMMRDVLIALIPVAAVATYFFGMNFIVRLLLSAVVMVGTEVAYVYCVNAPDKKAKTFKEKAKSRLSALTKNNIGSPLVSAAIYALIIPQSLDLYIVFIGAFLGIFLGKLVFGGLGANIFNPAAIGRVIIGLSFSNRLAESYGPSVDVQTGATALGALKGNFSTFNQVIQEYSLLDLFLGRIDGSMGEISALAIIIGGIYLFARRSADLRPALAMVLSFAVLMLIAGLAMDFNGLEFMLFQVLSGGLLFGAVYMITDPVTSPTNGPARIIYGTMIGVLVALIRLFGAYPEGVAFAIIFANMFVPALDYYKWTTPRYTLKFYILLPLFFVLSAAIVLFAARGLV